MPITLNTSTANLRSVTSITRVSAPDDKQAASPLFATAAVLKSGTKTENIGTVSSPVNYTPTRSQLLTQGAVGSLSQSSGINNAILSLVRQDSGQ